MRRVDRNPRSPDGGVIEHPNIEPVDTLASSAARNTAPGGGRLSHVSLACSDAGGRRVRARNPCRWVHPVFIKWEYNPIVILPLCGEIVAIVLERKRESVTHRRIGCALKGIRTVRIDVVVSDDD